MKKKAIDFYINGDNCAQCILKAVASEYDIPLSEQGAAMLQGMNNGLGIGCRCCLVDAGIMAFGLLFDATTTKRLRIKLLNGFYDRYGDLNCSAIKNKAENLTDCQSVIGEVATIVKEIIDEELEVA